MESLKDKTAIVGIGVVPFALEMGQTEWYTACQAIKLAVDDAGLDMHDIDGLVKNVDDGPDQMYIQKGLGMDNLTYAAESHWGTSPMMNAITAVASGSVNYAVYYQTAHRSSGPEKSISDFRVAREMRDDSLDLIRADFYTPFGLIGQPAYVAMTVRRYMHERGAKPENLGWIPVVASENASRNAEAIFFDTPINLEDYLDDQLVADPLRSLDCAPKVDGSIAIVVATVEKARSLKSPPVIIMAATQGTATEGQLLTSYSREIITDLPEMRYVAEDMYRVAGVSAGDIKVAMLDDNFAPFVPMQLEALGFCKTGEAVAFCEGGDRIRVGGELPVNTGGGAIGYGRFDSARIVEGVRQVRGTAVNQVNDADIVIVVSGAGGPADGLILRKG
ncbi:MAG: lipid-transfer protein [Dehalococcoidia bacterium]